MNINKLKGIITIKWCGKKTDLHLSYRSVAVCGRRSQKVGLQLKERRIRGRQAPSSIFTGIISRFAYMQHHYLLYVLKQMLLDKVLRTLQDSVKSRYWLFLEYLSGKKSFNIQIPTKTTLFNLFNDFLTPLPLN